MPLPLILGIAAGVAAAGGVGSGAYGAVKMKKASKTMKSANERHQQNMKRFEEKNKIASKNMDALGNKELEIMKSFEEFSDIFEKIQNKPSFDDVDISSVKLPEYNGAKIKKVSVGAGVLMSGISGAALGTAGGIAAAGATTTAVMALGTASTGTAIASLSGAAATNATLAAIGGGAIAAGGGGIALGTTILGASTLGVGLLIGGVIFSISGATLSNKADEAWAQMEKAEKTINTTCKYLDDLSRVATNYTGTLNEVNYVYRRNLNSLKNTVIDCGKTSWNDFTDGEKLITQNTVLLVRLLFKMCQVKLVIQSESKNSSNKINKGEVSEAQNTARDLLKNNFNMNIGSNSNITCGFTDDENYCIAISALMYYFALCDGGISSEEKHILDASIDTLMFSHALTNDAIKEIYNIKEMKKIPFNRLCELLDCVSKEKLSDYSAKLDEIINASEGISESESNAKKQFEIYLNQRNK
ncbi:MAG: hypothetical protein U0M02_12920 [Acutalibacteraceae bacterium]|nr:hypothetical protein [Acutalibacteraceae bacterium]